MSRRDKPRLSERFGNKSGDELLNEFKKEFENNTKNWFNSDRPTFSSFRRDGFPFDDDLFAKKSDAGIKSHLEDLAKKHPEFAGDLRCPPWGGSVEKNWEKAFNVPVSVEKSESGKEGSASESAANACKESDAQTKLPDKLNQYGLRNTVDIGEQAQRTNQKIDDEPKRSCSAPPSSVVPPNEQSEMNKPEPKRFTSKIEITPVNPFEQNASAPQEEKSNNENKPSNVRHVPIKPTNAPSSETGSPRINRRTSPSTNYFREIPIITEKNQNRSEYESPQMNRKQFDSPQMNRKHPQVHHIPIFVEGRKDPVIPKNTDEQPEQAKQFQPDQTPLKRKLDSNGNNNNSNNNNNNNNNSSNNMPFGNGPSMQTQSPAQEKEVPANVIPPPPPPKPLDPMQRIQEVQKEVENLTCQVEQYTGNSRTDKEYLYLDEMLTRNLIKLDIIEVEGNESLRTARKDAIRRIQKSIALLESKVPTANVSVSNDTEEMSQQENVNEVSNEPHKESNKNAMEVDNNEIKKQEQGSTGNGNSTKTDKSEVK